MEESISENVTFGRVVEDMRNDEIWRASEVNAFVDTVRKLPKDIDTREGERKMTFRGTEDGDCMCHVKEHRDTGIVTRCIELKMESP